MPNGTAENRMPDDSGFCLETEDLILKKASREDWKPIWQNLWRHPESARYMLWDVTQTEDEARDRMERTIAFQKSHRHALFIYEKATGTPIGFAGMMEIEPGVFEDIGVALGPDYTGKGYGTQVLRALIAEAKACGAHRFIASSRKQNLASRALQDKCGFVRLREEARVDPRNGEPYLLEISALELCSAGRTAHH